MCRDISKSTLVVALVGIVLIIGGGVGNMVLVEAETFVMETTLRGNLLSGLRCSVVLKLKVGVLVGAGFMDYRAADRRTLILWYKVSTWT